MSLLLAQSCPNYRLDACPLFQGRAEIKRSLPVGAMREPFSRVKYYVQSGESQPHALEPRNRNWLFLGKGEAGLRITSLRRLVADQKGDRRSAKGRGFSCRKRMIDQCLHQSASSMQGQRSDVFDKPVVLAPLYPAGGRIGAAAKYSRQLGRIQPRVFGRFLDRRSRRATRPGRRHCAKCGPRLSFDLANDELRNVPPRLPVCGGGPFYKGKALRFGPIQSNVKPAARHMPSLRG